ncbi:beta-ketoacyl synthase N-terminal-like domain-containing protein [Natronospira bacteriovora]|uniref:Beta-ketoacyl synthase N-terminal-like domain-containing protein n=1 Tax=Natronospira bacteriovora TaxID=3069753 RepID=A0ABU0W7J3_9GAMM|nr:beta-ketoacyl synthase N-terminal-like domain-containing protein [Natronospira sp. AB-CW4]MDQ2070001.1 beta-ketoacyl synthase N-terminal-like domain-containing protein [Natronospira sp. AB-CW4]
MTMPNAIQAVHLIGGDLACAAESPARALRDYSAGALPSWPRQPVPGYPGVERPYACLHDALDADQALDQVLTSALDQAGLDRRARQEAAVILGTSSLDIGRDERRSRERLRTNPDAPLLEDARWGFMLAHLCQKHGLNGPQYTFNTACSSSANALLYAQRMLSLGTVPAAIVIGFDVYTGISFSGFHGLMLLAREHYRPFDAEREGIVIGEGVAAAVLSRSDDRALARLDGGQSAIDPTGVTVASEDSLVTVMQGALDACAAVEPFAIKAHGTGTPGNDSTEAAAIHRVFGDGHPPFFSIKGGLGHTLGACGLAELLALMDCRNQGFLPASIAFRSVDDALPVQPLANPMAFEGGPLLLNYFGFGGNNTSLVVTL